ncbi:MAG: hypothetical protein Q7T97_05095 [Burkholderiaceae bacterium]|nr:hypothetical protein [Burkholderiaceae bacterium]
MVSRLVALLVALVVFWSGFAAQETSITFSMANAEQQVDARSLGDPLDRMAGESANAQHPDELPAPACAEAQADLPAILTDGVLLPAPLLVMARPRPYAAITRLSPDLDGPQRPPCAHALIA